MFFLSRNVNSKCAVTGNANARKSKVFVYKIAGEELLSNEEIKSLLAFKVDGHHALCDGVMFEQIDVVLSQENSDLHYQGKAHFNQALRSVVAWRKGDLIQIDIDGTPACTIDRSEKRIVILNEDSFDSPLNLELITGPAVILLLAQKSVYSLHASAVRFSAHKEGQGRQSRVVAFLADSGVGKSTLARHVGDQWCQLVDDILPVTLAAESLSFFDDFPQLKLKGAHAQAFDGSRLIQRVDFLVCLNGQFSEDVDIQVMAKSEALLALIRHTVAVRLFDVEQTKAHLEFAKKVVEEIPVLQISYPRDLSKLPEIKAQIVSCILS